MATTANSPPVAPTAMDDEDETACSDAGKEDTEDSTNDTKDQDAALLSEILEKISERLKNDVFPAVESTEVDEEMKKQAEEAKTWVKKDEAVRIQSFMTQRYQNYRESLPASNPKPEPLVHAEWARLYYYFHLTCWKTEESYAEEGDNKFYVAVPPEKLSTDEQEVAKKLLSKLKVEDRCDFVKDVKQALMAFMNLLPKNIMSETDMDEARHAWFKQEYYKILADFLSTRDTYDFQPQVALDSVNASQRKTFEAMCSRMKADDADAFHEQVDHEWKKDFKKMPEMIKKNHGDIKEKWYQTNYYKMLTDYLAQRDDGNNAKETAAFVFKPAISVEMLPIEERDPCLQLIPQVQPDDVPCIEKICDEQWANEVKKMPSCNLPKDLVDRLRTKWLSNNYYTIVGEVVKERSKRFQFTPAVEICQIAEGPKREEAMALVKLMDKETAKALDDKIANERTSAFAAFACEDETVKKEVEKCWLNDHYFEYMASVLTQKRKTNAIEAEAETVSTAAFVSPKKKARNMLLEMEESNGQVITRSILQCHTSDIGMTLNNRLEAYILHCEEECRLVDINDKRSGMTTKVPVLTMLLGDCTGAIQCDIWRTLAETTLARVKEWSRETDGLILLETTRFGVKAEWRKTYRPTKCLTIGDRTTFVKLDRPTGKAYLNTEFRPDDRIIVNDFKLMEKKPLPAVANVSGIVSQITEVTYTRFDVPMKYFRLQDVNGRYLSCAIHGRHVENEAIEDRAHVVIFLANAQSSNNGLGMLWLYDISHIVRLRTYPVLRPTIEAITLDMHKRT